MTAILGNGSCAHCGMMHGTICPRIKAVEYYENGSVKRVEYQEGPKPMNLWGGGPFPWWNKDVPGDLPRVVVRNSTFRGRDGT